MLLKTDALGGADRGEVSRVREQDQPFAFVVSQATVTVRGLGLEGGGGFVEAGESGYGVFHTGLLTGWMTLASGPVPDPWPQCKQSGHGNRPKDHRQCGWRR